MKWKKIVNRLVGWLAGMLGKAPEGYISLSEMKRLQERVEVLEAEKSGLTSSLRGCEESLKEVSKENKKLEGGICTVTEGDLDYKPTQKDKPSPTSHFHKLDLYHRKRNEYPPSKGYKVWTVADTNSMEPVIDDNTILVTEDFTTSKGKQYLKEHPIRVGDICLYKPDPKFWGNKNLIITHQVVGTRTINGTKKYKFKGHNNFREDPGLVSQDQIVGRAFEFSNGKQDEEND